MRDANLGRRRLLAMLARGGVAGITFHGAYALQASGLTGRRRVEAQPRFTSDPFSLGVAAGEPAADGFVIWTRLAPQPLAPRGGMDPVPVRVSWEVAEDEGFRTVVRRGEAIAHPELAHAVHVEVEGLRPQRVYHYRFAAGEVRSPAGRALTLPIAGAPLDRVRFVVAGCQHYEEGLYTAWSHIAREAPDFVFHYGDYIYEGADTGGRPRQLYGQPFQPARRHGTPEPYSLDEYRQRYALYKSDPDLQAAHAASAFFTSFDDHEVDNNWAGLIDQDGTPPEIFALRRAAAFQAFYEHMPLRSASLPRNGHMQMYRAARFGDLMNGWFLDTRQYRSDQPCGDGVKAYCADISAPTRTMMGASQESWLYRGLGQTRARWNLIAQQVMMMHLDARRDPLAAERQYATDTWSGYLAGRERLLSRIDDLGLRNVAIVTGDSHQHFVGDVKRETAPGKIVASEFLATSISSGADGTGDMPHTALWLRNNDHLKLMSNRRGYASCTVDRDVWRSDMCIVDTIQQPGGRKSVGASFVLEHGSRGVRTG